MFLLQAFDLFSLLSSFQNLIRKNNNTCPSSATFSRLACLSIIPHRTYYFQMCHGFHVVVTWLHKLERKIFDGEACHLFVHVSPQLQWCHRQKAGRNARTNEAQKMQDESLERTLPFLGEGEDSCMQNTDSRTQSRSLTLGNSYLAVKTLQHV